VLLAEDNPMNQTLATRILAKRGHGVVVAGNGREAVDALAREPFDVVLIDVQMPEMSGIEATVAIRRAEQATGRRIPIIALTAHALKSDREACFAAGMDAYVTKPVRVVELLAAIEKVTRAAAPPAPEPATPPAPKDILDREAALEDVGEEHGLLRGDRVGSRVRGDGDASLRVGCRA
jgi:two-component system sensor histidine kinase/response regulator